MINTVPPPDFSKPSQFHMLYLDDPFYSLEFDRSLKRTRFAFRCFSCPRVPICLYKWFNGKELIECEKLSKMYTHDTISFLAGYQITDFRKVIDTLHDLKLIK